MFLLFLLLPLLFTACLGKGNDSSANKPEVVMEGKEKQGPGDVWITPETLTVKKGDLFATDVHLNAGGQLFAAYTFNIKFDKNVLEINESIGEYGAVAGPEGFVIAVNTKNAGEMIITGFDTLGKGPGSDLNIFSINWKALNPGKTNVTLFIKTLVDVERQPIGKFQSFGTAITVE